MRYVKYIHKVGKTHNIKEQNKIQKGPWGLTLINPIQFAIIKKGGAQTYLFPLSQTFEGGGSRLQIMKLS